MTELAFSDAERRAMERLGDALIPPAPGALSASEAGIGGLLLDQILVLVPERVPLLRQVIARAGETPAEAALAALKASDPVLHDGFCETVVGAYFMSPEVRRLVAYPGRVAVPARIDVTDLEELLMPVLEQGFEPRLPAGSPGAETGQG
jgi:hypothetical protein